MGKDSAGTGRHRVIFLILFIIIASLLIFKAATIGWELLRPKLFDPAVDLAYVVKAKSNQLKKSKLREISFQFIPNAARAKKSPRFNTAVKIEVTLRPRPGNPMRSGIEVNNWSHTTFHNRFVKVEDSMAAQHEFGEPFTITLQKRGSDIFWTGLE
ncbi:MAG: hypothetical protein P1U89_25810 [Verrucomicrobiales bacterium]|nr:hypothetical protein [Verrucomicrobiales bacterium]